MWNFIAGCLISYIFESLVVKLYKDNFSNKDMSILGIIIGWLVQEHVRNDFYITGGKRFMVNQDFRNQFLTNILKVTRNFIFWSYLKIFFELGGIFILLLFFFLFYFFSTIKNRTITLSYFKVLYSKYTSYLSFNCKIKRFEFYIILLWTIVTLFFVVKKSLNAYGLFFIISLILYIIFSLTWLFYITYVFINNKFTTFGLILKLFHLKFYCYLLYGLIFINLIINVINFENLKNENFFQELIIKLYFFCVVF